MARKAIAKIRLANGSAGYFDEKSGIHLNWNKPEAFVYEDMNIDDIKRSIRFGTIRVIEGTIDTRKKSFKQVLMEAKSKKTGISLKELMGDSPIFDAADTVESPVIEEVVEEKDPVVEEILSEKPLEDKEIAKEGDLTVPESAEETVTETVEKKVPKKLSVKPSKIKSLKVGDTKDISAKEDVVSVKSSDEAIATVVFGGQVVTIQGVAAGNAVVTIKSEESEATVSVTVVEE